MVIQRTSSLIDREVYCADVAERKYRENLRTKGPGLKIGNGHVLAQYIEDRIANDCRSPQGALDKIKEEGLPGGRCGRSRSRLA